MNLKIKNDKLAVRIAMLTMSFQNNSIAETKKFLRDWKLKDLYELISGKYHYLQEQLGIIVDIIEVKAEEMYEEMNDVIERLKYLDELGTVPEETAMLTKMIIKMRKEMPTEEFKGICAQDPDWKQFFSKQLPALKKKYTIK